MGAVRCFTNLRHLDLEGCCFGQLPDEQLGYLVSSRHLTLLDMTNNNMLAIRPRI